MAINYGLILPPFCLCICQYVKLINKTLSFFFLELNECTSKSRKCTKRLYIKFNSNIQYLQT